MKRAWMSFPSLLALLALVVSMAACGGGGSGLVNDLGQDTEKGAAFTAVRFNDAGYADSALDRTVGLRTEVNGGTTVVAVAINDIFEMYGVTMELKYDATRYSPENVEFSGLIDSPIEMAVTHVSGLVAMGQVDTAGTAQREGDFAVVTFRNEPNPVSRNTSATMTDVMDEALYEPPALTAGTGATGWEVTVAAADAADTYKAWAVWAMGDGNSDGLIGIQDLTPLSSYSFWQSLISDTNLENAVVDYNGDGATNISDLTRLGQNFGELCTGLEFFLLDSATFSDAGAPWATVDWLGSAALTLPPAAGTTSWDNIFRNWTGNVPPADKQAADVDEDGNVWLFARAVNNTDNGPATTGVQLAAVTGPGEDVIITNMVVGVGGADYMDGDLVTAEANAALVLEVTGIYGTYQGNLFEPTDAGTIIPQTNYDDALASVVTATNWTAQNAGHADMRRTAPVLAIAGGTATVFPDDDPESDAGTPEGGLTATLPEASTGAEAGDVVVQVDVDVITDPAAPLFQAMSSTAGPDGDNFLLDPMMTTGIDYLFDYNGGVLPAPENAVVELYDLTDGATVFTFTYKDDLLPAEDGEFAIRDNPDPESEFIVSALLGPGNTVAGHEYALRLQINPYASVNYPGGFLVRGDYPLPVDFNQIPTDAILNANHDHLWLFYPEPVMRSNPRAEWSAFPSGHVVYDNWDAYIDVIKSTGSEFLPEDNWTHPRVTVVKDAVPSGIGVADVSEAGVFTLYRCSGYVVADIGALTFVDLGTADYSFAYRVFAVGTPLGGGTFDVTHMAQAPFAPVGINWGIDIFTDTERGDLDMAGRDYGNHNLNASSVSLAGDAPPDVLFVEYAGGDAYTWNVDAGYGSWGNNMRIAFHSEALGEDWAVPWDPRAVTSTGNVIAVHPFIAQDFDKPGDVTYGPFDPGQTDWQIQLTNKAGQVVFDFGTDVADVMSVFGTNPND